MLHCLTRPALYAGIIVSVSEVARGNPGPGALIKSPPLLARPGITI